MAAFTFVNVSFTRFTLDGVELPNHLRKLEPPVGCLVKYLSTLSARSTVDLSVASRRASVSLSQSVKQRWTTGWGPLLSASRQCTSAIAIELPATDWIKSSDVNAVPHSLAILLSSTTSRS